MKAEAERVRENPIREFDVYTDTRDILARARRQAEERGLRDYVIVDVDSHHVEIPSWDEVVEYVEDPVVRYQAKAYHASRVGAPPYGLYGHHGMRYQDVGGRITHHSDRREAVEE
ncbi:MAG: amidohydrolase, partial [Nitrospinota bacterium]